MKEKTLLKVALITSLVGLLVLYIVSETIVIEEKTLDKIDEADFGEVVKIKGVVDRVIDTENVVIVDIVQPEKVSVVLFKEESINITEGSTIEVIGELEDYNGEIEVIGHRVRLVYG